MMKSKNVSLKKDFVRVICEDGRTGYGGDQGWMKQKYARKAGCGVVAAANVLLYLQGKTEVSKNEFLKITDEIRRCMPIIPFFGMNGLMVAIALSIMMKKLGLGRLAFCKILPIYLYRRISAMIGHGIPVVLAIGRNFPIIGGKEKLNLYVKTEGGYEQVQTVNAHFVTVTAINDKWLTVSSWGRQYFINKKELTKYGWLRSSWLFTNIVSVR